VQAVDTKAQVNKYRFKERARVPYLVFLLISLVALFCVMDLPPFLKNYEASVNWKETAGISKRSGLSQVHVGKDPVWRNVVVYAYTVDGKEYTNDVIAFQMLGAIPGYEANQMRSRYSPGSPVTVYYDPKNPQDSCLDATRRWDILSTHLIMYLLVVALAYLSVYPPYKPDESASD
jgi:hypothetical protein